MELMRYHEIMLHYTFLATRIFPEILLNVYESKKLFNFHGSTTKTRQDGNRTCFYKQKKSIEGEEPRGVARMVLRYFGKVVERRGRFNLPVAPRFAARVFSEGPVAIFTTRKPRSKISSWPRVGSSGRGERKAARVRSEKRRNGERKKERSFEKGLTTGS